MSNSYFESAEFREILQKYEQYVADDSSEYLDADDFADIADYYLTCDDVDKAKEAVERGLAIHDNDEVLLTVLVATMIYEHRYRTARKTIEKYDLDDNDNFYQKAQLAYALDHDFELSQQMFRQWMAQELECVEECDRDELERDSYIHIISSFVELGKDPLENADELKIVRAWIDEYIDRFQPLGRYETDLTVVDICRSNNLSDLLVKVLVQVLDEQPYLKGGWATLALAHYTQDQYDQAIEASDFALAIDPHDLSAMLTRAYCHSSLYQWDEACRFFGMYLSEPKAEQMQGIPYADCLLHTNNRHDEALQWIETGLNALLEDYEGYEFGDDDDSKRYVQALFDASTVYQIMNRYSEAEKCMQHILDVDPNCAEALFVKGSMLAAQNKVDEALNAYGLAINKADDYVAMAIDVALTLAMNKMEEYALDVINAVERLEAMLPEASLCRHSLKHVHAVKALTLLKIGDAEGFLASFKRAIDETPELVKNVFKGYFPESLDISQYYDYAVLKINE